ncbi:MAG: hypothetical protein V1690_02720 [Candidatus Moraniibacteriota bacterium]
MAIDKSWVETWSEGILKITTFLWLPFMALWHIIKKLREEE